MSFGRNNQPLLASGYDSNNDGKVNAADDADRLGGQPASKYPLLNAQGKIDFGNLPRGLPVAVPVSPDTGNALEDRVSGLYLNDSRIGGVRGSFTKAALPMSGVSAGQLARVTDSTRGIWRYDGAKWIPQDGSRKINIMDFCDPASADNTAGLQAAIDTASSLGGATIEFPAGYTFSFASVLTFTDRHSVTLEGSNSYRQESATANLRFTGAGANAIVGKAAFGIAFRGLKIVYDNPAFSGHLIWFGYNDTTGAISQRILFENCIITGSASARNAASLIYTHGTVNVKIVDSHLLYANYGIKGVNGIAPSFVGEANVVILDNVDFNWLRTAIYNPSDDWTVRSCTFEPDDDIGKVQAVDSNGQYYIRGFIFSGNNLGDANAYSQPMVRLKRAVGGSINGNWFTVPFNATAIELAGAQGVAVAHNRIETGDGAATSTGIYLNGTVEPNYAVSLGNNSINAVNPITRAGTNLGLTVTSNESGGTTLPNQITDGLTIRGNPGTNVVGAGVNEIGFGTASGADANVGQANRYGGGIRMASGFAAKNDGAMIFSTRPDVEADFSFWNGGELLKMNYSGISMFVPLTVGGAAVATVNDLAGKADKLLTTNFQTGTTYTVQASDLGKLIICTNAAAIVLTIPPGLAVGFQFAIKQGGAGQVTMAAGSGVTLQNADSHTKTKSRYAVVSVFSSVSSEFCFAGGTAA